MMGKNQSDKLACFVRNSAAIVAGKRKGFHTISFFADGSDNDGTESHPQTPEGEPCI